MKTSELTDIALDWAVSQCMTGGELFQSGRTAHAVVLHSVGGTMAPYFVKDSGVVRCVFEPSTNWAQGGPIIEREKIDVEHYELPEKGWMAGIINKAQEHGPTPLIAAMRCFVASKLGDDIEIPEGIA